MPENRLSSWRRLPVLLAALVAGGCFFDEDVTEGPSPLPISRSVRVTVEYTQPGLCLNSANRCTDPVVFFGSWMRPGEEATLQAVAGRYIWTGTVTAVPVNFPPGEEPYLVRVFDPYLLDTPSGGVTAARLRVGGQVLTRFDWLGTPAESGFVFVDDNGVGHNPF
jgi:hypothetical protein